MHKPFRMSDVEAINYNLLKYPFIIPLCESFINCNISSLSGVTTISASKISIAWVLL